MNFWKQIKQIFSLRWDETSAVDHSANEEEGWAVLKSEDAGRTLQEVMDEPLPSLTKTVCPACGRATGKGEGFEACPECKGKENKMSSDTKPDDESKAFAGRIEALLASLPTDEDRAQMLKLLQELAERAEGVRKSRESGIRLPAGTHPATILTEALDRASLQEVAKQAGGEGRLKALFDKVLADLLAGVGTSPTDQSAELRKPKQTLKQPAGLDHTEPDSTKGLASLAEWVQHVIIKSASGWIEQRGVREFDDRLKKVDEAFEATETEEATQAKREGRVQKRGNPWGEHAPPGSIPADSDEEKMRRGEKLD